MEKEKFYRIVDLTSTVYNVAYRGLYVDITEECKQPELNEGIIYKYILPPGYKFCTGKNGEFVPYQTYDHDPFASRLLKVELDRSAKSRRTFKHGLPHGWSYDQDRRMWAYVDAPGEATFYPEATRLLEHACVHQGVTVKEAARLVNWLVDFEPRTEMYNNADIAHAINIVMHQLVRSAQ